MWDGGGLPLTRLHCYITPYAQHASARSPIMTISRPVLFCGRSAWTVDGVCMGMRTMCGRGRHGCFMQLYMFSTS